MSRSLLLLIGVSLTASIALAQSEQTGSPATDPVPATVEGGSHAVKEGGKEIGAGFRALGRGLKDVFTGQRSKEDFKETKQIGTGAAGVGKGVAGVGRGVGREIKQGVQGDRGTPTASEKPPQQ